MSATETSPGGPNERKSAANPTGQCQPLPHGSRLPAGLSLIAILNLREGNLSGTVTLTHSSATGEHTNALYMQDLSETERSVISDYLRRIHALLSTASATTKHQTESNAPALPPVKSAQAKLEANTTPESSPREKLLWDTGPAGEKSE